MAPPMCTTPSWWTARRDAGGVPVVIIGNYWRVLKSRKMPSNLTTAKVRNGLLRRRPELNRGTGICSRTRMVPGDDATFRIIPFPQVEESAPGGARQYLGCSIVSLG